MQRGRIHKLRNVLERLPDPLEHADEKRAACGLIAFREGRHGPSSGEQAKWMPPERPDAAATLLEGLQETFTFIRLRLTPTLIRCLASTKIIENPNGGVRRVSGCAARWHASRLSAALRRGAAFLEVDEGFRRIQEFRDLWVLAVALGRARSGKPVAANARAA